ncbi:MAG: T9SS type A sorting domain-containing protein [Bacteroidales bacterium]|nr:T9SS type A sorting domain-containing protein [Bacteroidales bacterium]
MKKNLFLLLIIINFHFFISDSNAQALKYSPLYPTMEDSIIIIYDASKGNASLSGETNVYAHTGVITDMSVSMGDWKYKPALWYDNDSLFVKTISLGNNLFKLSFNIMKFYKLNNKVKLYELCFVFRNKDGSKVGKNADGSDFYIPIYKSGFSARFIAPKKIPVYCSINENLKFTVASNQKAAIKLYYDKNLVSQTSQPDTLLNWNITPTQTGKYWLKFNAQQFNGGAEVIDSLYFIVQKTAEVKNPPAGIRDGINYINDNTVILQLFAPMKNFVYVIGDFNNDSQDWQIRPEYLMNKTTDGKRYWIQIKNLTPLKEYSYQYYVDFELKIADPWADKQLDPFNDKGIAQVIYPNLKPYPEGKTNEIVSVLQTAQTPYQWEVTDFKKPDNRDLIIYELLVRDFSIRHTYKFVSDSIQYLKRLGITAIELMPVIEFDGNESWGYMPSFFFAPDKVYGTKNDLKKLIDVAHKNGISVIFDIVLNHTSGQNSFVNLYYDKDKKRTKPENPYFNVEIPHPYGHFYDFNHASAETQFFVDTVLNYWVEQYKVDGFRFDLSKGFTNKFTGSDVGAWGQYDTDRVYYLKRMAEVHRKKHPNTFFILEHFANNDEETELHNNGFMIWGNANFSYGQAAMGWLQQGDDFSWNVSIKSRNWWAHNLIGYMESHDEERNMFRCLNYGNEKGDYSTKDKSVALERMALIASLFIPIPGPKMIWQFGETGYDYSIYWPGNSSTPETRTMPKPAKWNYLQDPDRFRLYKIYSALNKLKTSYSLFKTSNFELYAGNYDKRLRLWDDGYVNSNMSAVIVGNFSVEPKSIWPEFTKAGKWYDYFTQDSISISDGQTAGKNFYIDYKPGEFHIYTDVKLPKPDLKVPTVGIQSPANQSSQLISVFPNPFNTLTTINYSTLEKAKIIVKVFNLTGQELKTLFDGNVEAGEHRLFWDGSNNSNKRLSQGIYLLSVTINNKTQISKITLISE